jgi:transposase
MIYCGIDLHSDNMVIVALNNNKKIVRQGKIRSSTAALEQFFTGFDEPVKAVVECTSFWYWLSDWCRDNGIELILAHAKMVKAISYAKVKTDKVDAKTLAELLQADLIPEAYQIKPDRRALRELTRGRLRMTGWRSKLQSTLWNLAGKHNVHINEYGWRELDKLRDWLSGRLPPAAELQAKLMLAQISQLQKHIHRLEQEIEKQGVFTEAVKRLMEIPGIGKVNAWTILAEIGDITRFPTAKQFVSYCRLVPGSSDSGGKHRHKSGNKDGNKYLRMAFGQAGISAYTHYGVVKKFYNKVKRRSGKPVARVVVGKELAKIVWHMLTKNQEYQGFKGQATKVAAPTYWPQPISPFA